MQDEVDYSRFYYQRQTDPVRPPTHPTEFLKEDIEYLKNDREEKEIHMVEREEKGRKKGKKIRGKKVAVTLVILVLCFTLVFFGADFFGNGFLTEAVGRAFSGTAYEYYYVAVAASSKNVAYANSLHVRQTGGGGYIIAEEGYYVAYAVYSDKTTALAVQTKNKESELYTVKFKTKENLAKDVDSLVTTLEKAISEWEKGDKTEVEIMTVLRDQKAVFSAQKEKYSGNMRSLVDLICDGLDGFSLSATEKITQLSELRYFLCCVVYSAQSVFN